MGVFTVSSLFRKLRPRRKSIWDRLSKPLNKQQLQAQLSETLKKPVLVIDQRSDLLHKDLRNASVLVWLDFKRKDRDLIDDLFELLSQESDAPLCLHLKSRRDMRLLLSTVKEHGSIPQKVLAYVLRPTDGSRQILVCRKNKDKNIEIIRGRVDPNETPEHCLLREIEEESGLHLDHPERFHFESVVTHDHGMTEFQLHHCYFLKGPETSPEAWTHEGTGQGADRGECFRYAWLPLRKAGMVLKQEMKEPLGRLRSYLRQSRETMSLAPRLNV